jgi:hypothetical protein
MLGDFPVKHTQNVNHLDLGDSKFSLTIFCMIGLQM